VAGKKKEKKLKRSNCERRHVSFFLWKCNVSAAARWASKKWIHTHTHCTMPTDYINVHATISIGDGKGRAECIRRWCLVERPSSRKTVCGRNADCWVSWHVEGEAVGCSFASSRLSGVNMYEDEPTVSLYTCIIYPPQDAFNKFFFLRSIFNFSRNYD